MSFRESVRDLNSNEFRSPPSARHWNTNRTPCKDLQYMSITSLILSCVAVSGKMSLYSPTFICSSNAVRRETRCVRLAFVTVGWPSRCVLLSCTICWASSSQRRRRSVGWSAGTMPWSGESWKHKQLYVAKPLVLHFLLPVWLQINNGTDSGIQNKSQWLSLVVFKHSFWLTSQQNCWTSCSTLFRSLLSCSSSSTVVAYRFWKSRSIGIEYDFWTQEANMQ